MMEQECNLKTCTEAFRQLGISGYEPYDFRTNFATECCEARLTAKQTADLMGHADTRMVEKVYARRRDEGVLKHRKALENIMSCAENVTKKQPSKPYESMLPVNAM